EAGLGLAHALRDMGKAEEAAATAERLAVIAPDNIEVLLEIARAHLARGQGFYAVKPAAQAEALAPRDWRPPFLLAVAYELAERDGEALAAHRRALALAPQNPSVLSNLAMFQAARGQTAEAEALLRQAVAQPEATATIRQNLALILGLQGRLAEAEALARQDLPPQTVSANLAYLRSATAPAAAGGAGRSWESVSQPHR
ncbi:tetratricopeptide repeat protein, partial [Phenylobacterium sp.]|uniref:tetratricopeptide repeat protein n=1 Tax=Phenylobacterium sp. TaxID=1871053 RepID=UPI0035C852B2